MPVVMETPMMTWVAMSVETDVPKTHFSHYNPARLYLLW
jgi:hypothetical protein